MNIVNWIFYLMWVGFFFVGVFLGNFIIDLKKFGLDFVIVVMFIGLFYF